MNSPLIDKDTKLNWSGLTATISTDLKALAVKMTVELPTENPIKILANVSDGVYTVRDSSYLIKKIDSTAEQPFDYVEEWYPPQG